MKEEGLQNQKETNMIKTRARKLRAAKLLAEHFRTKGSIPNSIDEYALMTPCPMVPSTVLHLFRGWAPMLETVRMVDNSIFDDLAPKPKAAPKPKPKVKANAKDD